VRVRKCAALASHLLEGKLYSTWVRECLLAKDRKRIKIAKFIAIGGTAGIHYTHL
jgi:hypothetical protein